MFVSGAPLRAPGPRGEQQVDRSFMMWFNAGWLPQAVHLPENDWVQAGEVVLSTDAKLSVGARVDAGGRIAIGRRSVVVLRELAP
jgi:glycogen operon protein